MGAPKIKIYQLPNGYSEDGDNDVQQITNDEILPVADKPVVPEDFELLTGVEFVEGEALLPIDLVTGQVTSNLTPDAAQFQAPVAGHTDILITPSGTYAPIVIDNALETIAPSGYTLSASGVHFNSAPYPSGASIKYYRQGTAPATTYVGEFDGWYAGDNWMHRQIVYIDSVPLSMDEYTVTAANGLVTLDVAASGVTADYAHSSTNTKYYVGNRENWTFGHMYMNPDIFKGLYDYPGDDTEDPQGNPIVQGAIPEYVEEGSYQIDFRKGMVTFPEAFDNTAEPVYASFASLVGVRNVTSQTLTQITADPSGVGYVYKAVSDNIHPESIGSRWISRNDAYTPRNFYVDGDLKPRLLTVSPFDTLTLKQG